MSNAPGKAVSFSRPKVGYFSNRPRTYTINQQVCIYKYVQSHTIILPQHVSVTNVTIIKVSSKNNTIKIQMVVQKCMIKTT